MWCVVKNVAGYSNISKWCMIYAVSTWKVWRWSLNLSWPRGIFKQKVGIYMGVSAY